MKIMVINGTQNKGCTYKMKEMFLEALGKAHEITEYRLPDDAPVFCTGCKACFFKDISVCPHREYTLPIWNGIKEADLIVITSPVYVFHATGQIKALLDHYGTKWMAHSPEKELFLKKAVIITNAVGQGMKNVIKDIGDSLDFWGVARRYSIRQALFVVEWEKVSEKKKQNIRKQCIRVAKKVQGPVKKPRFRIRLLFKIMGIAQKLINKSLIKKGESETIDYRYWKKNGWLNGDKPWKANKKI
jgi:multimeric flavodoxin WrbA